MNNNSIGVPELGGLTVAQYFGHEVLTPLIKLVVAKNKDLNKYWINQYEVMKK